MLKLDDSWDSFGWAEVGGTETEQSGAEVKQGGAEVEQGEAEVEQRHSMVHTKSEITALSIAASEATDCLFADCTYLDATDVIWVL